MLRNDVIVVIAVLEGGTRFFVIAAQVFFVGKGERINFRLKSSLMPMVKGLYPRVGRKA